MAESLHCSPETITTLRISYERESHSIVSDSCDPMDYTVHGISPGQNTGVGSLSLLQGILPAQESN